MPNSYFKFKQFTVYHDRCAMKVTTDSCFFGAWAAQEIKSSNPDRYPEKIKNVLDIGTGSGLLSLMIAQNNEVKINAVEFDAEASGQARENIEASPWKNKIEVFNSDIRSFHPQKKYDCIICNPPFYENELASGVPKKNIAHHSKELTISDVLQFIKVHLTEDGIFFLMYPFKRKYKVDEMLRQNELYVTNLVMLGQSVKHSPFRIIVKGSNKKIDRTEPVTIAICDENQQYTNVFTRLLKDYYLYL